jgi:hypothetical protein
VPDTTPPVVTAATLNRTSVPANEANSAYLYATVMLAPSNAPVEGYDSYVFDAAGNTVGQSVGGATEYQAGTVQVSIYLQYGLQPGTYTVGFTLGDRARLQSSFGTPWGQPMPGGPLQLTVTAA